MLRINRHVPMLKREGTGKSFERLERMTVTAEGKEKTTRMLNCTKNIRTRNKKMHIEKREEIEK